MQALASANAGLHGRPTGQPTAVAALFPQVCWQMHKKITHGHSRCYGLGLWQGRGLSLHSNDPATTQSPLHKRHLEEQAAQHEDTRTTLTLDTKTPLTPAVLQHLNAGPCCCCLEPTAQHVHLLGIRLGCKGDVLQYRSSTGARDRIFDIRDALQTVL